MRGLSVAVAMVIMLMILIIVIVPALILFNEVPVYGYQGQFQGSAMLQLQKQQNNQVFSGNPNIYYNSSSSPSLQFHFNSLPAQFNISQIYYYNGTVWVPVLKSYILVSGNAKLPLPPKAFNKPVIVLTALGNVYFLNPNTSTLNSTSLISFSSSSYTSSSSSSSKYLLDILAFEVSSTSRQGVPPSSTVTIKFNGSTIIIGGLTGIGGAVYYVTPGIYFINDTTLSISGAAFKGWYIVGNGAIIYQNQGLAVFRVWGPTVLEAIYEG